MNPIIMAIIVVTVIGLIGAVILALSLPGIAGAAKGAEDAGTLHAPQMEGRYIEAEINFIWEPFAYVGDSEAVFKAVGSVGGMAGKIRGGLIGGFEEIQSLADIFGHFINSLNTCRIETIKQFHFSISCCFICVVAIFFYKTLQ